jgi:anionic cell wall polymer biosynthesis LytR-Cps2A-Psr (LCP) family protein
MARKTSAMDGFTPRRPERKVGGVIGGQDEKTQQKIDEPIEEQRAPRSQITRSGISRAEIDASLNGIDDGENESREPRQRRQPKPFKPQSNRKKWIKRALILILVIVVCAGAYVGVKTIIASGNVFKGSILDVFQNQPLKQDENGRSNVLILGTSEDDPGHDGANLTDSMMILSLDQNKKNAFMISIPRDLYVKYNEGCNSGYAGKINEYYNCVHDGTGVDADRAALTKEASFVGSIFGLDIQYGVNVNYTVMREMVNAVGGSITVTIESRNPNGQMDSNFDWKCGVGDRKVTRAQVLKRCPPNGHFIDYPNGPAVLDAEHALYLAQARGDHAPTYGFEQSNFDREKNQQKIIKALREKAVSAGTLTDFSKVSAIVDALGNNLRTTFESKEFRTLVSLAQDIKSDDIKSISLIDGDNPVMTTGMIGGLSAVKPAAGDFDYSQLRSVIAQRLSSDPVQQEAAPIAVLNGSGVAGVAQTEANKLKSDKFVVETVANAPAGTYPHYTLYQIGSGNAGTLAKLLQRYSIKVTKGTPPISVESSIKFVLIIGPPPTTTSN